MSSYEIRPLGFGEILDQGFRLFRENVVLFFFVYGLFLFVPQVVLQIASASMVPSQEALQAMTPQQQAAAMRGAGTTVMTMALLGFVSMFVIGAIAEGAVVHAAARRYLDEPVTASEAISAAMGRFGALMWTSIVKTVVILFGFILLIIPGIYFLFRYALTSQTVMLENLSGSDAMKRSRELMRASKHINQLFGIGFIFWVFSMLVGGLIGGLIPGISGSILSVAVSSVIAGLYSAMVVVLYFSARCRVDGFDLTLLAKELQGGEQGESVRH